MHLLLRECITEWTCYYEQNQSCASEKKIEETDADSQKYFFIIFSIQYVAVQHTNITGTSLYLLSVLPMPLLPR